MKDLIACVIVVTVLIYGVAVVLLPILAATWVSWLIAVAMVGISLLVGWAFDRCGFLG
jgi:hypothetical protein